MADMLHSDSDAHFSRRTSEAYGKTILYKTHQPILESHVENDSKRLKKAHSGTIL